MQAYRKFIPVFYIVIKYSYIQFNMIYKNDSFGITNIFTPYLYNNQKNNLKNIFKVFF